MTIEIVWTHWIKGGPFHWNEFRLNNGNPYESYRFGPILIRRYLKL